MNNQILFHCILNAQEIESILDIHQNEKGMIKICYKCAIIQLLKKTELEKLFQINGTRKYSMEWGSLCLDRQYMKSLNMQI